MKNNLQTKHKATISFSAHLFIFILLASLLSSCGIVIQTPMPTETVVEINLTIQSPETVEATSIPPTEVVTEMPTASLTPEATATATEILEAGEISTERKQEIIDRVNAFINAEGQYSDEELRKDPTWFDLDTDESKPLPLGMLDPGYFQGILVEHDLINNNHHLFMGTLLRTGERAVFDYSFSGDYVGGYNWKMSGLPNFSGAGNYTQFSNIDERNLFLDSVIGKPLSFVFMINLEEPNPVDENMRLLTTNACQEYMTDLYNLVPIVEEYNFNRPNDNEQSALYFTKDNLLGLDDFDRIKNNILCGIGGLTIRKP